MKLTRKKKKKKKKKRKRKTRRRALPHSALPASPAAGNRQTVANCPRPHRRLARSRLPAVRRPPAAPPRAEPEPWHGGTHPGSRGRSRRSPEQGAAGCASRRARAVHDVGGHRANQPPRKAWPRPGQPGGLRSVEGGPEGQVRHRGGVPEKRSTALGRSGGPRLGPAAAAVGKKSSDARPHALRLPLPRHPRHTPHGFLVSVPADSRGARPGSGGRRRAGRLRACRRFAELGGLALRDPAAPPEHQGPSARPRLRAAEKNGKQRQRRAVMGVILSVFISRFFFFFFFPSCARCKYFALDEPLALGGEGWAKSKLRERRSPLLGIC
ncbi:MAG: hypothetical protein BJ554DRAFT_6012 [Olpidium bornovanus]|uniref:Uncharacterized protein n=1 Tax=Olpidium bornovanus TaxID=278681 RepID=A0A8H7ZYJ7_9FUNG|nr:MAG: hypothetical protein BJ554DRAFT_6012 [Olpidium bornovanus]